MPATPKNSEASKEALAARLAQLFRISDFEGIVDRIRNTAFLNQYPHVAPKIPKNIFIYWDQGWNNAPEICRICADSWAQLNQNYNVQRLSYKDLANYIPEDRLKIYRSQSIQSFSDNIRLELLLRHGGVWADATAFCTSPIDRWISMMSAKSRTFMFSFPSEDRSIDNWFISSTANAPLVEAWHLIYSSYVKDLCARNERQAYYFSCHFCFDFLLKKIGPFSEEWGYCPKIFAWGAFRGSYLADLRQNRLAKVDQFCSFTQREREEILDCFFNFPVQKLTYTGSIKQGTPKSREFLSLCEEVLAALVRGNRVLNALR